MKDLGADGEDVVLGRTEREIESLTKAQDECKTNTVSPVPPDAVTEAVIKSACSTPLDSLPHHFDDVPVGTPTRVAPVKELNFPEPTELVRQTSGKAAGTRGNAYMLLYRRGDARDAAAATSGVDVPAALRTEVEADNALYDRLQAAFAIKQSMVELEVYCEATRGDTTADMLPFFLDLPQITTVAAATDAVRVASLFIVSSMLLSQCVLACCCCIVACSGVRSVHHRQRLSDRT